MGTLFINLVLKDRQKKNGATEDLAGKHVQECSRRAVVTKSQKLERMEYTQITSVKATSLGLAQLKIQRTSSPWFHQEAVALIGLNTFIYLFIYLFIVLYTA